MRLTVCGILIFLCFEEFYCLSDEGVKQEHLTGTKLYHFRYDYTFDENTQSWYKLHQVPATWFEAYDRCKLEGAELASPLDEFMLEAMLRVMKGKAAHSGVYTGIHSTFSYGDYYTLKGVPLDRLPVIWSPSAPFPDRQKQHVLLYRNGTISNVNRESMFPYICYRNNINVSLGICGTVDKEYKYVSILDACYKFHPMGETWYDSFKTCSAEGGHLLIINSEEELKLAYGLFKQYDTNHVTGAYLDHAFVGFIDWRKNREWVTVHDEKLMDAGYSTWALGEPNNNGQNEFCGSIHRSGGFNDAPCDLKLPFFCEKKPASLLKRSTEIGIRNYYRK